jgi:hypothetical protein
MPEETGSRAPALAGPSAYDLRFTINVHDYAIMVRTARRSGMAKVLTMAFVVGACLMGALAGVVIATTIAIARGGDPEEVQTYGIVLGIGAIVILYWLFLQPVYIGDYLRGQPIGAGETRLRATETEIESDSGGVRIVSPWSSVERIVDGKGHVLVFFARLAAHIVPKRAFATPAEAAAFVEFARARAPSAEG